MSTKEMFKSSFKMIIWFTRICLGETFYFQSQMRKIIFYLFSFGYIANPLPPSL